MIIDHDVSLNEIMETVCECKVTKVTPYVDPIMGYSTFMCECEVRKDDAIYIVNKQVELSAKVIRASRQVLKSATELKTSNDA